MIVCHYLVTGCSNEYREYDGTCNNERNPMWGSAGQTFQLKAVSNGLFKNRQKSSTSDLLTNLPQSIDPVTEWLTDVLHCVLNDILDLEFKEKRAVNLATTYLDLSNVYGRMSGKIDTF